MSLHATARHTFYLWTRRYFIFSNSFSRYGTIFFLRLLNSANTQQSNCLSLPPKKRKNFELNSIVSLLACCFQHLLNNNPVKVFKIRSELIFKSKFLRRGEQKVISFCLQGVQVSLGAIFHT